MDFLAELRQRALLHDFTPGLEDHLASERPVTAYIGFDPTAPSLTIGNYVPIMLLKLFQRSGHQPIMLFGGATGRIGDPSGKDAERQLKSTEEIEANLAAQRAQAERLLRVEPGSGLQDQLRDVRFVDNFEFYRDFSALDFLRQVGKTLTVNYMMSKDSVRKRLESGISFTEFSYQLLQGYDFERLYADYGCTLQMGGSDQWGNITAGTEFVRRNLGGKAYGLTAPLLTKADGSKFGKSESGNIWLDPELTSPYRFYQFWLDASDADLGTYLRYFSLRDTAALLADAAVVAAHVGGDDRYAEVRAIKLALAEELTGRIHGPEALAGAQAATELLFNRKAGPEQLAALDLGALRTIAAEIPSATVARALFDERGALVTELLSDHGGVADSRSEARRAVENNAVSVNKRKVTDPTTRIGPDALLHGRYLLIENGKKNKAILEVA